MAGATVQLRPPKLRHSCDRCGIVKLRCDRGQPGCARCASQGLDCVYGFSRKSGKRPRRPSQQQAYALYSRDINQQSNIPAEKVDSHTTSYDSVAVTTAPLMCLNDIGLFDIGHNNISTFRTGLDVPDAFYSLLGPSLLGWSSTNIESSHFSAEQSNKEPMSSAIPLGPSTANENHLSQSASNTSTYHIDRSLHLDCTSSAGTSPCVCPREASEILGSFNQIDSTSVQNTPASATSTATGTTMSSSPIEHDLFPYDLVLRLNREASDRLARILTCTCAESPHLALLYASIVSRILLWYQQAATSCCAQTSTTPYPIEAASFSEIPAWPRQNPNKCCLNSPDEVTAPKSFLSTRNFAAHEAARMQAVFQMQMLNAQMRQAGSVVDLFASAVGGRVGALHRLLVSWLRGEHSRVAGIVREKLNYLSGPIEEAYF